MEIDKQKYPTLAATLGPYYIYDWAGNLKFDGKQFETEDDAESFLCDQLGDAYESDREEYEITTDKPRESRFLDTHDPRAGMKRG
jgi:hypothetical protein